MVAAADLATATRHYAEEVRPYEDGYSDYHSVPELNFDDVPF